MNRLKITILILLLAPPAAGFADEIQGSLVWGQRLILGFPVTGVISELHVQAGSPVKQKQLLAKLDTTPFDSQVRRAQSAVDRLSPMIFDAQQEYDQAQELFDRTVLSEMELQKTEVRLKGLQAEQSMARAELELAQWQRRQSQLLAPFDAVVVYSNLLPGMVISEENQAEPRMELARAGVMQVQFSVTGDRLATISMHQQVKVVVGKDSYQASVKRIEPLPGADNRHSVQVEFTHPADRRYVAGQAATVIF